MIGRELFNLRRVSWLVALLAAVLVYANSLHGEFILDDRFMIEDNPRMHSWQFVPEYFSEGVWHNSGLSDLSEISALYYRPLHLLLMRITNAAFGANTFGYHVVNLLLFLANISLVYFLARQLLERTGQRDDLAASAAALIFAVHPTHTESVSWISGATDPLAFIFVLASVLFYLRSLETDRWPSVVASVVCFALGLLTKETVIVLPALFVAYNILFKHPVFPARLWIYVALMLAYLAVRASILDIAVPIQPQMEGFRYLLEFVAGYVKLLLLPWPLHYYYIAEPGTVVSAIEIILGWMVAFAVLIWTLRHWRREPLIAFGVIWIAVTLAPTLIWAFHEDPAFAVRYLYPPSIGLALIVARVIHVSRVQWPRVTTALVAVVTLSYAALTIAKNNDWQNEEVFFTSLLAVPSHFEKIHAGPLALLGRYYYEHGKPSEAMHYFTEAAKVGEPRVRAFCDESIGLIFGERGDYARSTEYYLQAYQIKPKKSSVLVGLGNNAYATHDLQQALRYYTLAYEADAKNRTASYNLSLVYAALGDARNAAHYRQIADSITDEFLQ
ncbi:MAG: glycosyltransferase family 39 protein [Gammaproteobacteria bacterium]|nr:glycosyltransferase family 39 protein [Gammaproteobacteria bacterium]